MEENIAMLGDQQKPELVEKTTLSPDVGTKREPITDSYEPGLALDLLEQETGMNKTELDALFSNDLQ